MGANEARPGQAGGSNYVPSHMNFKKSQVIKLVLSTQILTQSTAASAAGIHATFICGGFSG